MKATTVLCLTIAAAAFTGPASAVFKCTTAKGTVYQDRPCREGTRSSGVSRLDGAATSLHGAPC